MEKLLARATEMQASHNIKEEDDHENGEGDECPEMERVMKKGQALRALHERFWSSMMDRLARLQEGQAFFSSTNEVAIVLPLMC